MAYILILGLAIWVFVLQDQVSYLSSQVKKLKNGQLPLQTPTAQTPQTAQPIKATPAWKKPQTVPATVAQISEKKAQAKMQLPDFTIVKLFSWIGGFILLLGIAFWIKYAIDNSVLTPSLRIGCSVMFGVTLWVVGAMMEKEKLKTTSYTLCASGLTVCFIAWYSAYHFYQLISETSAFIFLAATAVAALATAIWKNAKYIGYLAQIIAFLTPCLFHTDKPDFFFLFSYVAIVDLAVIIAAWKQKWHEQIYGSVLFTFLFLMMSVAEPLSASNMHIVLGFTLLFSVLFGGVYLLVRLPKLLPVSAGAMTLVWVVAYTQIPSSTALAFISWTAVWGGVYLAALLTVPAFKTDRYAWGAGGLVSATAGVLVFLAGKHFLNWNDGVTPLLLAAIYMVVLALVYNWQDKAEIQQVRLAVLSGLVILFATLSLVGFFSNEWLTIALAIEGAALIWIHHKYPVVLLPKIGLALLSAVGIRLLFNPCLLDYYNYVPRFFNWFLYTYGLCAAASFVGATLWKEKPALKTYLYVLGGALAFALVNLEIASFFANGGKISLDFCSDVSSAAAYTVAWALCGAGCLFGTIYKDIKALRVAGLGLVGLALAKLFLSDIWQLSILPRIIVLIGVAVILIGVSFAYQQFKKTN